MIVVSDTSVVTSLIQVDRLTLLQELYGTILIPAAVSRELSQTHTALPAFLEIRVAQDRQKVMRLTAELDLGEAEAIVLAKECNADLLLIDEKLGRAAALREGLRITGLIGVAVEARRVGRLKSVRAFVNQLELEAGFRVSPAVKEEACRLAGE